MPDLVKRFKNRSKAQAQDDRNDRTAKCFWVSRSEIQKEKYDLSLGRYQEQVYRAEELDPPREILGRLKSLEKEILQDMLELEELL